MIKTKNLNRAVWLGTICVLVVMLVSHTYNDILITTRHGIDFWDILKNGQLLDFYSVNITRSGNVYFDVEQGCAYNILIYIVFAIWNFPLYLLETFGGVDVMNSVPCLVYSKLLMAAGVVATAFVLKKIMKEFKVPEEQHELMLYLYVSSTLLGTVVFITGQYDILSLIFQLLGLLAYVKGKDKEFVLWFGIAFCFKYFAAIVFLPLMLLRHKKVAAWIKYLALLVVPVVVTKLPFLINNLFFNSNAGAGSGGDRMAASFMYYMLADASINNGVNLFIIVYAAILIWCYLQDQDSARDKYRSVWVCMVSYVSFFGLMNAYPYWSVLMVPFVTLAIALSPKELYLNLILETIGYAALVGVNMIRYPWVYFGNTLKPMVWPHILEGTGIDLGYGDSFVYYVACQLYGHPEIQAMINAVFLASLAAVAYTTYPGKSSTSLQKWPAHKQLNDVLAVRFLANAFVCLLPIIGIFI